MWQDYVIMIVSFFFVYALVPQIIFGFKKKKPLISYQTSTLNILGMSTLGIIYMTLNLPLSSILSFLTAALWLTLLIQRIVYR